LEKLGYYMIDNTCRFHQLRVINRTVPDEFLLLGIGIKLSVL
jgi:hypothetical protein